MHEMFENCIECGMHCEAHILCKIKSNKSHISILGPDHLRRHISRHYQQ